jgi:tetratricopeptide (TPR) repeat protein
MELAFQAWSFLTSVDGAKFLSAIAACVTILSGGYGLLKAYRFGERQIGNRIAEFLEKEEKRLSDTRESLRNIVQRPNPAQTSELPVFPQTALRRALQQMGWGRWKPEASIAAAADRCEQQVTLARRQALLHEREQALAHLLLGAIADARSDHAAAFSEFEKALELDSTDVQALEYAGLQLLKLSNPIGAAQHFQRLVEIAKELGDHLLQARAYRHLALAHEQLGALPTANGELIAAIAAMPSNTDPLEVALTYEQHGRVRGKAGYENATESLQKALVVYSGLSRTIEGQAGIERINAAIKRLNERSLSEAASIIPATSH